MEMLKLSWTTAAVVLLLAAGSSLAATAEKNLPSSWQRCKRDDPNIDSCLKTAINQALSDISSTGLKELGVLPIDPLKISQITVTQGSGPVLVNMHLRNVTHTGFRNLRFKSIRSDMKRYIIKGNVETIPLIKLVADYTISGRILVFPISGQGKCHLALRNIQSQIEIHAKETTQDGKKYMKVTHFKFPTTNTELFTMRLDNLFNGNKQLSDRMNKILNDNWSVVLNAVNPAMEQSFGEIWGDIANRILLKVPLDNIFEQ